ncbi:flagellar protein FlaG [Senegalia massiliensis]|uniref:Flagellar biosynthesis protein FlaG n=1 Tax=Senegalia massiliensis TaxID=1720316 RepID=A0A845QYX3_9CLOT|nr:flagellar protein FlaG [Senegalia massiliensis]NBI07360.1 flagellar biosynthesis protein FlaG [Senegalia massiliensis]
MSIEGIVGSQMSNISTVMNKEINLEIRQEEDKSSVKITSENGIKGEKRVSKEELIHAVNASNESLKMYDKKLEYSIHEKTNTIMVKLVDTETDEIIREIPSEKILDMIGKMWEIAGIIIDERV